MSESRLQVSLIAIGSIAVLLLIAVIYFTAILAYALIGLAALLFIGLIGFAIRKWQHSGLAVHESKREYRRLAIDEQNAAHQRQIERERHEQELALERERHEQELELHAREYALKEHVMLTRVAYDQNGNPPILLDQENRHITMLPAGNPPYRPAREQLAATSQQQQIAQQAESQIPAPVDAYELLQSGQWKPDPKALLLAMSAQGLVTVAINLAWHIALAGATGNGKTNQLRLLLAQLVKFYETYYISPAFAPIKANHEDWRQIEDHLAGPVACEAREIQDRLMWAVELYKYRQQLEREGDFSWRHEPIYVVIDEYIAVIKRYPGAVEDVSELLRFARQYQVFVIVASQDFLIKNIGGDSGARDCYRTALYFGGDPVTARTLLDIQGTLPYEQDLGKSGLLVLRTKSTQVSQARAPFMSNRAVYELLGWPADPILDDAPVMGAGNADKPAIIADSEPVYPRSQSTWSSSRNAPDYTQQGPSSGPLQKTVEADTEPMEQGTDKVPASTGEHKQLSATQELTFIRYYRASGSIKAALGQMHLSYGRYQRHASQVVAARKLRANHVNPR